MKEFSERVTLFPLRAASTDPSEAEGGEDVDGEGEEAGVLRGDGGVDDGFDGTEDLALKGLDGARPSPVGGDEGAGEGFDVLGECEDGAGEWELETDEVDGEEGRLFRSAHECGDGKADGGHGGVDEEEEDGVFDNFATEGSEVVYEEGHP